MSSGSPRRTWGFRFSVLDGVVLAATAALTVVGWPYSPLLALFPPMVLGHFFLFCNVFRIHRRLELLWAGVFVLNAGAWLIASEPSWAGVLAVQSPVTVALIVLEIRQPRYHGVWANRLNPHLESYLNETIH